MTEERKVMFETLTLLQAEMEFEIRPGQHTIVKHINPRCKRAILHTYIPSGSVSIAINAKHVCVETGFQDILEGASYPLTLTVQLQSPSMLPRGWARYVSRSSAQILTDEQDRFIFGQWKVNHKLTAAALREKMDAHFEGREELQLMEYDIQKYLN
eukprot:gene29750-37098_t